MLSCLKAILTEWRVCVCALLCLALLADNEAVAQPTANFTATTTTGCAPLIVNFSDLSTGSPTSWNWDFGNGNVSVLQNPGVVYTKPGIYEVTLVSTNGGSDTMIKPGYITVYAPPVASFSANTTSGCAPVTINFQDQSTPGSGAMTSWFWDFGDGNFSTLKNPVHTYTKSGIYTIFLKVVDANGCQAIYFINDYINIGGPVASFEVEATHCPANAPVQFTGTSTGNNLAFIWNFGDGGTSSGGSPSHVYGANGTYDVVLNVQDGAGCTDTAHARITLRDLVADFDPVISYISCDSGTFAVTFNSTAIPAPDTYLWAFGDGDTGNGTTPVHVYDTGTYTVTFIPSIAGSCLDTVTKIISYELPRADYTQDIVSTCVYPTTVNFTDNSTGTGLTYNWTLSDSASSTQPSPSHLYTQTGNYTITLEVTDSFGCIDDMSTALTIQDPQALFTGFPPREGCVPLNVAFTNLSSSIDPITGYKWYFGNGDSSTLPNPSELYDSAGTYDVTLIVYTQAGCTDTALLPEYVKGGIKPDYSNFTNLPLDTVCHGGTVIFNDSSGFFDTTYKVNEWCWSFHYATYWKGIFPLKYEQCPNPGEEIFNVTHRTATIEDPSHLYDEYGVYSTDTIVGTDTFCAYNPFPYWGYDSVRLIVGYNACYDTVIKPIYVDPPMAMPGIKFDQCSNQQLASCSSPIEFGFFNASDSFDIFNYYYIVNEQTGDTVADLGVSDTIDQVFTTAGNYGIHISVTNSTSGCTSTNYRQLTIDSTVNGFRTTPTDACIEFNSFTFTDTTTSLYGLREDWLWIFGDGDTISGINEAIVPDTADGITYGTFPAPTHVYKDTGTFVVYSRVLIRVPYLLNGQFTSDVSYRSCYYESWDTIVVNGVVSKFGSDTTIGCPGLAVQFTDSSKSTSNITNWFWDFGDDSTSTTPSPTHNYDRPGVFSVELRTLDDNGCRDTLRKLQHVAITQPVASFGISDTSVCPGDTIQFTNKSTGAGVSYVWNFGDATLDSSVSPKHAYGAAGSYTVVLTATDSNSCVDLLADSAAITVNPKPVAGFTQDTINADCPPFVVKFTDTSLGMIDQWNWEFGDSQFASIQNPVHIYTKSGTFTVSLAVETIHGCVDTALTPGLISVGGPNGTFTFEPDSGCVPLGVTFNATATNAAYYIWDFGDGSVEVIADSSGGDSIFHIYTQTGILQPNLSLQDTNLCVYIVPSLLNVYADDVVADINISDSLHCGLGPILFTDLSSSFFSVDGWHWSFGDGDTSTNQNPSHTFDSSGTYTIILEATSLMGCTGGDTFNLEVVKQPDINVAISDTAGCVPVTTQFSIDHLSPDSITGYSWTLGDGTTSLLPDPVKTYSTPGVYEINFTGSYANGRCFIYRQAAVSGYAGILADFDFFPKDAALNNSEIQFVEKTINATIWDWDFGDNNTGTGPTPKHKYVEAGTWPVTLIADNGGGCPDTVVKKVVIAPEAYIKLPNAFSPNGDGLNDEFRVLKAGIIELIVFRIYNRWGEMVFETFNIEEGWDGRFRGKPQDVGSFVYYVEAVTVDSDGESVLQKGSFSLLR